MLTAATVITIGSLWQDSCAVRRNSAESDPALSAESGTPLTAPARARAAPAPRHDNARWPLGSADGSGNPTGARWATAVRLAARRIRAAASDPGWDSKPTARDYSDVRDARRALLQARLLPSDRDT